MDLCILVRRRERRRGTSGRSLPIPPAAATFSSTLPGLRVTDPEPIRMGSTHLTQEALRRCQELMLCVRCGHVGPVWFTCPVNSWGNVGELHLRSSPPPPSPVGRPLTREKILPSADSHTVATVIDCGGEGSILDATLQGSRPQWASYGGLQLQGGLQQDQGHLTASSSIP